MVVAGGWGVGRMESCCSKGITFQLCKMSSRDLLYHPALIINHIVESRSHVICSYQEKKKERKTLRYNFRSIKFTYCECTIQWFLVNLYSVQSQSSFKHFSSSKKFPQPNFQSFPTAILLTQAITDLFCIYTSLFWELQINRIIQYLLFGIWRLSLSKCLKFIHVVACINSPFLFIVQLYG